MPLSIDDRLEKWRRLEEMGLIKTQVPTTNLGVPTTNLGFSPPPVPNPIDPEEQKRLLEEQRRLHEYLSSNPSVGTSPFADVKAPSLWKPMNIIREKFKSEGLTGIGSGDIYKKDVAAAEKMTSTESWSIVDNQGNHIHRTFNKKGLHDKFDEVSGDEKNRNKTYTMIPTKEVDAYQARYKKLLFNQDKILRPLDRNMASVIDDDYLSNRSTSNVNVPFQNPENLRMINEIRASTNELGQPIIKSFGYYNREFRLGFDPEASVRAAAAGEGIRIPTTDTKITAGGLSDAMTSLGVKFPFYKTADNRELLTQHYDPIMRKKKGELAGSEGQKQGKAFMDEFVKTRIPLRTDTNITAYNKMVELDSLLTEQLLKAIQRRDNYLRTGDIGTIKKYDTGMVPFFQTESLADIEEVLSDLPLLIIKNRSFIANLKGDGVNTNDGKTEWDPSDLFDTSNVQVFKGIDKIFINGEMVPIADIKKKKKRYK